MNPKMQLALKSFKAGLRGFPLLKPLANYAKNERGRRLQKYGLLFEDIIIEEDAVVKALSRLPAAEVADRERRLFRAFDLNMKKKELPEEMRDYDPYRSYLGELIEAAEEEQFEREVL
eukprot:CAMPEP_0116895496 /NCGR_PEP_ID=MMETSP0467-20121206/5008_1 /TAXON_ID=283647 /ORGANISM="Mesodinium pulex, Strain SPMC105" /LENGTH=117 /DNA_ID=CAMNT_0004566261 /DNA_START=25 /DNA_END=374 /DNA_ORIENTATION=+